MTNYPRSGLPEGAEIRALLWGHEELVRPEIRCFIPGWCGGRGAYSVLVWDGPLAGQVATVSAHRVIPVWSGGNR